MRNPAGVWVIGQVGSASGGVPSQVNTALDTPGVVGYGPRVPASFLFRSDQSVDLSLLDRHRSASRAKGKLFKPRVIWGKYTPSWAMGPRISGFAGPAPYLSGGGANSVFEAAYRKLVEAEVAWADDKDDVRELDCGWYSLNYSELYNGPEIQQPYGLSRSAAEANFIEAHKRLINIGVNSSPVVPVGFGLSGHGPIGNITKALAAHAASKPLGSIFVQANGWEQGGEWGGPLESTHDQNVWVAQKGKVACALQDISAPSGRSVTEVTQMWSNARALQAQGVLMVYVEQYYYQWDNGGGRFHDNQAAYQEFLRQIDLFVPTALVPTDPDAEELAALYARLDVLEDEGAALESTITTLEEQTAAARTALEATNAEIADVQEQIAALEAS